MLKDQDFAAAVAIQRKMYTSLNEVAELTDELSQAVNRQDQVSVRMFLSMRLEELERLTGYQAMLHRQCAQLLPEDARLLTQLNSGRFSGQAPPGSEALLQQAKRNRTVLERVRRADEAVSSRLGGSSSFYRKKST